jgi:hypothetical protein
MCKERENEAVTKETGKCGGCGCATDPENESATICRDCEMVAYGL